MEDVSESATGEWFLSWKIQAVDLEDKASAGLVGQADADEQLCLTGALASRQVGQYSKIRIDITVTYTPEDDDEPDVTNANVSKMAVIAGTQNWAFALTPTSENRWVVYGGTPIVM
jgi:hypothetical protein